MRGDVSAKVGTWRAMSEDISAKVGHPMSGQYKHLIRLITWGIIQTWHGRSLLLPMKISLLLK
ncbi:MAG: copper resistance protein CopC [Bacteroidales bacterium]|nr:copper resistance protein CopC [Bacteroidales bacterium]